MTCIAGWVEEGHVWIGGDSAGVAGLDIRVRKDEKVFVTGEYVMGFTSSFRMGQLLRYKLIVPAFAAGGNRDAFMSTVFIDTVRQCLGDGGFRTKKDEVESGGTFLVGVAGALYYIDEDFQVGRLHENFEAIGCGQFYAMGALAAFAHIKLHPRERLRRALAIAEKYSVAVRRPFVVKRSP